jgi:hypothetical protein
MIAFRGDTMKNCRTVLCLTVGLALLLTAGSVVSADKPGKAKETIRLSAGQKEYLTLEPILVTARLKSASIPGLPAGPGKALGALDFDIKPAVKVRPKARPLPLEAKGAKSSAQVRTYDLTEWFQFPAKGSFTVRAVVKHKDGSLTSEPITFTIRRPAKGDAEAGPVDRIHHTPWSNYDTNAFCGDTFDVVKRWPKSKLARYCHYWNGRYSQHKKEYAKALASYRVVVDRFPDFPLAEHAAYGIAECLLAQDKKEDARKHLLALRDKLKQRAGKSGDKGQTVVQKLVADALRTRTAAAKK